MDAYRRAESIKKQLLAEWHALSPDLFIRVEDGDMPILKIYGARELYGEQFAKAESLVENHDEIEALLVECVFCSKSAQVMTGGQIDQPVGNFGKPQEEDGRGVWLLCDNEDGHKAHDWGDYEPLPK